MTNPFSKHFPLDPDLIHLNHAAVAPWPNRTAEAIKDFADENIHTGSKHYSTWLKTETELRTRMARFIGATSPGDIALQKNTSEAISAVACGLEWRSGDNVVTSSQEFPSNRIPWESLTKKGVELRQANLTGTEPPENAILNLIDERTRVLTISSVQYDNGLRINLKMLGDYCSKNNILFCIDAIQSIGALAFNVEEIKADFVMADGHKWMCGPEGIALFYSKPQAREQLSLNQFGWRMVEPPYDFDSLEWNIASDAKRFECGSPNFLGVVALNASLSLLEEIGIQSIEQRVLANTCFLIDNLPKENFKVLSPQQPNRQSGILTIRHNSIPSQQLYNHLVANGVLCALRGGGVRLSPHFYTSQERLESCLNLLDQI